MNDLTVKHIEVLNTLSSHAENPTVLDGDEAAIARDLADRGWAVVVKNRARPHVDAGTPYTNACLSVNGLEVKEAIKVALSAQQVAGAVS